MMTHFGLFSCPSRRWVLSIFSLQFLCIPTWVLIAGHLRVVADDTDTIEIISTAVYYLCVGFSNIQ